MRRGRLAALAALVLAIVLAWWLRRDRAPAAKPAPVVTSTPLRPSEPPRLPPAPPPAAPSPPVLPGNVLATPAASPYPPGSQPLTEGSDPATTSPEDDPVDEASGLQVVLGPRRDVVHPPDPIVIDVQLLDRSGRRLPLASGRAYFRGERDTARAGTGPSAPLVDDGTRLYTARFQPPKELLDFRVFVEVALDVPGFGPRRYSTWVEYTPLPGAELDGTFAERVAHGSLYVDAGLRVARHGRYKVIASLYAGEQAVCFAQASRELDAGARAIPLEFFGKILHDRGLDGPYTLRYVMAFEEFPGRGVYWPGVTVDPAYTTRPYRAAEFSPDPYTPPPDTEPEVTAQSPSQQGKPPPLFTR